MITIKQGWKIALLEWNQNVYIWGKSVLLNPRCRNVVAVANFFKKLDKNVGSISMNLFYTLFKVGIKSLYIWGKKGFQDGRVIRSVSRQTVKISMLWEWETICTRENEFIVVDFPYGDLHMSAFIFDLCSHIFLMISVVIQYKLHSIRSRERQFNNRPLKYRRLVKLPTLLARYRDNGTSIRERTV